MRDERVLRVLARDNDEVDDGWLCDKGRFAYQSIHVDERITEPLVRDGGVLRPVSLGARADEAAAALAQAQGPGRGARRRRDHQRGGLPARRACCARALGSPDLDCRAGGVVPAALHRALARPGAAGAPCPTSSSPTRCSCSTASPSTTRRSSTCACARACAATGCGSRVVTSRPSSLDPNAERWLRFAPGSRRGAARRARRRAGVERRRGRRWPPQPASTADEVRALADLAARAPAARSSIVWGERLAAGARAAHAVRALLNVAARAEARRRPPAPACSRCPTAPTAAACARPASCPTPGPGYADPPAEGRPAERIAAALADGELTALYLLHADPLDTHPDRAAVGARAAPRDHRDRARVAPDRGRARARRRRLPGRVLRGEGGHASTHPDGRLQRLRPAIGHPGDGARRLAGARPSWRERLGHPLGVLTGAEATAQLAEAVPFYAGLTLDEIGGRGVRWQEREAARGLPEADAGPFEPRRARRAAPSPNGALRLGTFRSIWAARGRGVAGAQVPRARASGSSCRRSDAQRLGIGDGDRVEVVHDGGAVVRGAARCATAVPAGTALLEVGTPADSANALTNGEPRLVEVHRREPLPRHRRLLRALVDPDHQGDRDLRRRPAASCPIVLIARAQAARPLPGAATAPTASARTALLQPLADIVKLLAQGAVAPAHLGRPAVRARADHLDHHARSRRSRSSRSATRQDIFGTQVGLYGIDVSIGPLYLFAFGAIAFYGLMLGGWASGSKYSFLGAMRAAAQLISYEVVPGPGAGRRDHHRAARCR